MAAASCGGSSGCGWCAAAVGVCDELLGAAAQPAGDVLLGWRAAGLLVLTCEGGAADRLARMCQEKQRVQNNACVVHSV